MLSWIQDQKYLSINSSKYVGIATKFKMMLIVTVDTETL